MRSALYLLPALTLAALVASPANAAEDEPTLYRDSSGRLYVLPGEGRVPYELPQPQPKTSENITIVRESSPEFPLGKESRINMRIVAKDDPDMWLQAGVRVQSTFENQQIDLNDGSSSELYDAYLRRVRFEVGVGFDKHTSFIMDIRNDKANFRDKGEQEFNVGDAYLNIKKPFDSSLVNFKFYRGKIDVSRTETVKSARTIHYDRPHVADEAAQFINHNRRATNAQMYGDWRKKVHYQVAFGDGIASSKFKDADGSSFKGDSFEQSAFFYGAKVVFSPFDGWEERSRTETYFGQGKHLALGAAYWRSPEIAYNDGTVEQSIDHSLLNVEFSGHYNGLFAQAEYFRFDGVVKNFGAADTGRSDGWYVTSEYVFTDLHYFAPFARYESWDKFNDADGYTLTSRIIGANWYLRGNTVKAGISLQNDKYGVNIGDSKQRRLKITTQWFF